MRSWPAGLATTGRTSTRRRYGGPSLQSPPSTKRPNDSGGSPLNSSALTPAALGVVAVALYSYDLLERQKPELEKALPEAIGVERFTRTVLTELRRTPKLLDCSPESLLGAMMLAAQLGLEPGPLGLVYLVPFKGQVEFIIGYRG